MADLIEVGLLPEILTNEDVGIFVETPFPSAVRMREVGLAVQDLINSGVSVGRDFLWIYENERQRIAECAKFGKPFAVPSTVSRRNCAISPY
jgi:hypothetical protein